MSIIKHWVNGSSPYLNATNLNDMDVERASGYTYVATCSSAASASAKSVSNISAFDKATMFGSPSVPHFLYVLFSNGSTSSAMTITVNGSSAQAVKYRGSTSISGIEIAANDIISFIYYDNAYHMLGSMRLSVADVAHGGTGRQSLTANAVLLGNGQSGVKQVGSSAGAFYSTDDDEEPQYGTLPITLGGTGSTTEAGARSALGVPTVYKGTGDPSSSTGANGDLYFKYTA